MSLKIKKGKEVEIMDDQELWSLLEGYGPNDRDRPQRHMSVEERGAYLLTKVKKCTANVKPTSHIRLVLEIRER